MRIKMYAKLASVNLRKNSRLYLPQMLTMSGLLAVFYIMLTLSMDHRLNDMKGGRFLPVVMSYGMILMGIMTIILLLYTNGFLMKQRRTEFGLYHILGMEKRHINRILFFESLETTLIFSVAGVGLGILLYKLFALLFCRVLRMESVLGFYHVSYQTIIPALLFFLAISLANYIRNVIYIARLKPVELLQSARVGEREPRVRWLILILGLITLGSGYYIALTTENPLSALTLFFIAVLLVVAGTYLLFMAGSIAILKLLKKNRTYYYQKKHMPAVSGMLYRMKQNAVGLASITVLSTCVLVMMSTTICLYAGIGRTIQQRYPYHLTFRANYDTGNGESTVPASVPMQKAEEILIQAARECGVSIKEIIGSRYLEATYLLLDDMTFSTDQKNAEDIDYDRLSCCCFITAEEYRRLTGETLPLKKNQVAVYEAERNVIPLKQTLKLENGDYEIALKLKKFPIPSQGLSLGSITANSFGIVVSDEEEFHRIFDVQAESYGTTASLVNEEIAVDFSEELSKETDELLYQKVMEKISSYTKQQLGGNVYSIYWDSKAGAVEETYGLYGSLLFLGLFLSLAFIFATVLIIYYKQISEGYEDRERFLIMEKVGMSRREVNVVIRQQILLIFFSPLAVAAIHITAAFPILCEIVHVGFGADERLLSLCMLATFVLFVVVYTLIYRLTARTYEQIVHRK